MDIKMVKIDDIVPYKNNAKKHPDDQVEHIANSIKEFGFRQPLVIDQNNVVVIGHGRLLAAKRLGMDEVPVLYANGLTDAQVNALRLADNKTNESEWDFSMLEAELDDLRLDFDMSDFGFDLDDDDEQGGDVQEDEVPEPPEQPQSKIGDIYQLGEHRLICGDSTDPVVIDRLMDWVKADGIKRID